MSLKINSEKEKEKNKEMEVPVVSVDDSLRQQDREKCDECPICYQEFAYKTELPDCGHKFCFLCIKGVALRHGACPLCRKRIPCSIFLDPVVKTLADQSTTTGSMAAATESLGSAGEYITSRVKNVDEVQWFYGARHGGWWRYERRHENEIEEAYQHGLHSIDLLIAGSLYCVNFDSMCQYRKDLGRTGRFTRAVKRVEEGDSSLDGSVRGIAGLRASTQLNMNVGQSLSEDLKTVTVNLRDIDLQ